MSETASSGQTPSASTPAASSATSASAPASASAPVPFPSFPSSLPAGAPPIPPPHGLPPPNIPMPPFPPPPGMVNPPPGLPPPPGFPFPPPFPPPGSSAAGVSFPPPGSAPSAPFHPPASGHRPGLGAFGAPSSVPAPNASSPSLPNKPTFQEETPPSPAEKFSLYVGSIAKGISDGWLEKVLKTAGPLVSLKRVKDAEGNPKAFGFAEYGDPESVLRCLETINGASIPGIGTGDEKKLVVKADDKTKLRLAEYEKTREDNETKADELKTSRNMLESVINEMRDPNAKAVPESDVPMDVDKPLEQLPSTEGEEIEGENKEVINKEIAFFRERAALRREAQEDKRREQWENRASIGREPQSRAFNRSRAERRSNGGPQGYDKPVDFVSDGGIGSDDDSADEKAEEQRVNRQKHEAEMLFRDRERKWENRERTRRNAIERERKALANEDSEQGRRRDWMREKLANWDDEREKERGKELFYVDRLRWRNQRRSEREKEDVSDQKDREAETEEADEAQVRTDAFLNEQADLLSKAPDTNRKTGISLDESTPIRLTFGGTKAKLGSKKDAETDQKAPRKPVFAGADDDEEEARKKKGQLVPLSYSDDEDEASGDDAGEVERRNQKVEEIVKALPDTRDTLNAYGVDWDQVDEKMIQAKIEPFVVKKVIEYLGMEEDSLVNAIVEHVRQHKPPSELEEELEMVLAEEAADLTLK